MDLQTVLGYTRCRSLFDKESDEFKKSSVDNNLIIMASLNRWRLLDDAIKEFKQKYKDPKDSYIRSELTPTLLFYLSHLRSGEHLSIRKTKNQKEKDIISELKHELYRKIESKYSLSSLVDSYLNDDEVTFKNQNKFFKIDFKEDQTEKFNKRDLKEDKSFEESYTHLYKFLKNNLIPDFKKSNFQGNYIDNGGASYQVEYLVKFYLQNPSKENYLKAIEYAVNILYLEKEPYHQFFLFRLNFNDEIAVKDFYNKDLVGVHFNTKADMEDWNRFTEDLKPKQQYVQRFKQLQEAIKENDVIVIGSYRGIGYKVGIISKGTRYEIIGSEKEFDAVFQLENVQNADIDNHPFVQTLIPATNSISRVKRMNYTLRRKIFPRIIVQIKTYEIDDKALEVIVGEWLRTPYAPEEYRLQYMLMGVGGNKKDIDIYEMTIGNEKLIVQISNTDNKKTIQTKIKKLEKYKDFKQLFFFNTESEKTPQYEVIDIKRVISDFRDDEIYKNLVEELE